MKKFPANHKIGGLLLLVAVNLTATPSLIAQSRARASIGAQPLPAIGEGKKPGSSAKLVEIQFAGDLLPQAVEMLLDRIEQEGLPPLNVLFERGLDDVTTPPLRLRNVTAPDALRLLVTAAGCGLEPIHGAGMTTGNSPAGGMDGMMGAGEVIGYRVMARGFDLLGGMYAPQPLPQEDLPANTNPQPAPTPTAISGRAGGDLAPAARMRRLRPDQEYQQAGTEVAVYGGGITAVADRAPEPVVRVYPLASATVNAKFSDIEETLLKTMEMVGTDPKVVRIALHEKTNVMVVRATVEVHEVVAALLESLGENSRTTEASEVTKLQRRFVQMEMVSDQRQQAMRRELDEERERRRVAEKRVEEYRLELEELRAKVFAEP